MIQLLFAHQHPSSSAEHTVNVPIRIRPNGAAPFAERAVLDTGAAISRFDKSILARLGISDITSGVPKKVYVADNTDPPPPPPPPPFPTSPAPAKLATPYRIATARCPMTEPIDYSKLESAIGLNWYEFDPNLSSLMDQYLSPQDRGWAEERLQRWGEICGGPIAAHPRGIGGNPAPLGE